MCTGKHKRIEFQDSDKKLVRYISINNENNILTVELYHVKETKIRKMKFKRPEIIKSQEFVGMT